MQVVQHYARPSSAAVSASGLQLSLAAESSRPDVSLDAVVRSSRSYALLMLALYAVVSADQRTRPRDYTAYQQWVQERYVEELARIRPKLDARRVERARLQPRVEEMEKQLRLLRTELSRHTDRVQERFNRATREYFNWLYNHDRKQWFVLDPVVSVHPDAVIFEVFSVDESSYGRVTVPLERLDARAEPRYGTTNVDFSRALARELKRVRSYRPAQLRVGSGGVEVGTALGSATEKKIDLPPTWTRGFLQVQSASTLPAAALTLSAGTVAEVLSLLRRRRERQGPRSLLFRLRPGEVPEIVIQPWGTTVREARHRYSGERPEEIRVWGRRRLLVLADLLPDADDVDVRLLGTGMPSYWSVALDGMRLDLGLSGWTRNDWSRAAQFDLLASTATPNPRAVVLAAAVLAEQHRMTPADLAAQKSLSRDEASAALQHLCREGQAMYDHLLGAYRWRQLFPPSLRLEAAADDERLSYARRVVAANGVSWKGARTDGRTVGEALVRGEQGREFTVQLTFDDDGRVAYTQCTCSVFRRDKLRKGPCGHILATTVVAVRSLQEAPRG